MPVIKSAKKKLRQDRKKELINKKFQEVLKTAIKKAKKSPSEKTIKAAISLADKATKKNIFHKNKTARLKSSLSKLIENKTVKEAPSKKRKQASTK